MFIDRSATGSDDHVKPRVHPLIARRMNPIVSQQIPHRRQVGCDEAVTLASLRHARLFRLAASTYRGWCDPDEECCRRNDYNALVR